jgi:hypothetical protein
MRDHEKVSAVAAAIIAGWVFVRVFLRKRGLVFSLVCGAVTLAVFFVAVWLIVAVFYGASR